MDENMKCDEVAVPSSLKEGSKEPEVMSQCQRIEREIKFLDEIYDKLEAKLYPVLRLEPEKESVGNSGEESSVPLTNTLNNFAFDINKIRNRFRNLMSRVEV